MQTFKKNLQIIPKVAELAMQGEYQLRLKEMAAAVRGHLRR